MAAWEARKLYYQIASFGELNVFCPLASEFMNRWLAMKGGTRKLTSGECASLLREKEVVKRWIPQLRGLSDGQRLKDYAFRGLTASKGSNYYYALGWFTVFFTGCVSRKGNVVTLEGTFRIVDRYDWQDCGDKYVTLLKDRIYDKWAKLVEDHGKAKAFDVEGTWKGKIRLAPSGGSGGGSGGIR